MENFFCMKAIVKQLISDLAIALILEPYMLFIILSVVNITQRCDKINMGYCTKYTIVNSAKGRFVF